jgi:hypothetical protein
MSIMPGTSPDGHTITGASMGEHSEQGNRGTLPRFPDREDGQERAERSEKHGRKLGWLDTISLISDTISPIFELLNAWQ